MLALLLNSEVWNVSTTQVKVVRDTMNQMIDAWKEIPDVSDDVSPPLQSRSSSRGIRLL